MDIINNPELYLLADVTLILQKTGVVVPVRVDAFQVNNVRNELK